MTSHTIRSFAILALVLTAVLLRPLDGQAQSIADYTAVPPFVSDTTPPNILIIFDNSGSMQILAHAASASFSNANLYTGIFEPTECYKYVTLGDGDDSGYFRGDPAGNPEVPEQCANAEYAWSGNFLNYIPMRRIDIAKQVMIGGNCDTARDALDKCPAIIKGQDANFQVKGNKQASVAKSALANLLPSSFIGGLTSTAIRYGPGSV